MPQPTIINVEPLAIQTIEVRSGDRLIWTLRDDVPAHVLIRAFEVVQLENAYQEAMKSNDANQMADAFKAYEDAIRHHCGEIVRHSYPEVSDEEVGSVVPTRAQNEILRAFFSIRLRPSGAPELSSPSEPQTTGVTRSQRRRRHR